MLSYAHIGVSMTQWLTPGVRVRAIRGGMYSVLDSRQVRCIQCGACSRRDKYWAPGQARHEADRLPLLGLLLVTARTLTINQRCTVFATGSTLLHNVSVTAFPTTLGPHLWFDDIITWLVPKQVLCAFIFRCRDKTLSELVYLYIFQRSRLSIPLCTRLGGVRAQSDKIQHSVVLTYLRRITRGYGFMRFAARSFF